MKGWNRRLLIAASVLAFGLLDEAAGSQGASFDFGIRDMLSPQWIEELKPGREAATNIEFEAFEFDVDPDEEMIDEAKPTKANSSLPDPFSWDTFSYPLLSSMPPNFRRQFALFLLFVLGLLVYAGLGYWRNRNIVKRRVVPFEGVRSRHTTNKFKAQNLTFSFSITAARLKDTLENNFALVADQPAYFEACTWSRFRIYASGRTSCNTLTIWFKFIKRQCPWHEWLFSFFLGMEDTVTIEMWLPIMDCVTLAITRKKTNKKFLSNNEELLNTMHVYQAPEVPDSHRAYINSKERCVTSYASYVIAKLEEYFPQMRSLYIVDSVPEVSGYRKYQRMKLEFKYNHDVEWLNGLVETLIHIADFTKNYTVKEKTRELIEKSRQEMVGLLFKEEIKRAQEEAKAEALKNVPVNVKKQEKKVLNRPTQRIKILR